MAKRRTLGFLGKGYPGGHNKRSLKGATMQVLGNRRRRRRGKQQAARWLEELRAHMR